MLNNLSKRCEQCKEYLDEVYELRQNLDQWMACLEQLATKFNILDQTHSFLQEHFPALQRQWTEKGHPQKGSLSGLVTKKNAKRFTYKANKAKADTVPENVDESSVSVTSKKSVDQDAPEQNIEKITKNGKTFIRYTDFFKETNNQALGVLSGETFDTKEKKPYTNPRNGTGNTSKREPAKNGPTHSTPAVKLDLSVSKTFIDGIGANNAITSISPIAGQNLYGLSVDNIIATTTLFDLNPCHPPETFTSSSLY